MEIGKSRRFRSKQERRQIVEETLRPGASVAQVARAHEVNANQVFNWRKLYRQGRLGEVSSPPALVPVTVTRTTTKSVRPAQQTLKTAPAPSVTMEIDLGHARVRIEGADADCVRATLDGLLR
jgi:transposase